MIRIKYLRERERMTQGQLAEKIGSSTANISKYELEQTEPNLTILKKLSDLFDVSIDYIIGLTDNPTKPKNNMFQPTFDSDKAESDFLYIMGSDGTRKKLHVPPEKVERFRKLIEAGLPEIFEE